jgi:hypothetical protein
MPADTPPPSEDRIFELLCKTGLSPAEAFTLFAGIREMASTNIIARFESKLDAMRSEMRSEMNMLRWLMGLGFAALVAAAIAQLFRG